MGRVCARAVGILYLRIANLFWWVDVYAFWASSGRCHRYGFVRTVGYDCGLRETWSIAFANGEAVRKKWWVAAGCLVLVAAGAAWFWRDGEVRYYYYRLERDPGAVSSIYYVRELERLCDAVQAPEGIVWANMGDFPRDVRGGTEILGRALIVEARHDDRQFIGYFVRDGERWKFVHEWVKDLG